jgi:glycerophosphoryl diester phosphodiesterase
MSDLDHTPGAVRSILVAMRRFAWPLFLTSVFYRIIAFTLLAPLVGGLTGLFLSGSGRIVISNEEIAAFLLEPLGVAGLIVTAAVGLTLVALEQSCLMTLVFRGEGGVISVAAGALKHTLTRVFAVLELAGRIVLHALVRSLPFLALSGAIIFFLLSGHDINYYLAVRPPAFNLAVAGILLLGTGLAFVLTLFAMRVVFSLPILLFEGKSPRISMRSSALASREHRLRIVAGLLVWGVIALTAVSAATGFFLWIGRLAVPVLLGRTAMLVLVIGALFLAFNTTQLMVNIAVTAGFSLLVMHWYDKLKRSEDLSKRLLAAGEKTGPWPTLRISVRVIAGGTALAFAAAAFTGWLLLSDADIEDRTEVAAHRGASGAAPENTMAAVERAIADGAHWVEIDVQRTADDQVVVIHDRDLMKIGGLPLVVTESRYADLSRVDVGSWFDVSFADQRIPTLAAVLDRCRGRIKVNIELKYYPWDEGLAPRVIEIVTAARMEKEVAVMSLKIEGTRQVKTARPGWQTGLLSAATLGDLTRVEVDFLAVHSRMVTPGFVRRVHRAGKTLHVWTVNDVVGMTRLFGMGVDAVITDVPALAVRLLDQRSKMDPVERLLVTAGLLVAGEPEHVDPASDGV